MKIPIFGEEFLLFTQGATVCLNSYANLQQIGFSYRSIQFYSIGREIETVINRCQS